MVFSQYYSIPRQKVVFEIIENEAIVIQQKSGFYYSMRESAGLIWSCLAESKTPKNILGYLCSHYRMDLKAVEADFAAFIQKLENEELIVPCQEKPNSRLSEAEKKELLFSDQYVPPVLERFDDMKNYIAVDPIHDVGAVGWPDNSTA